jgi:hypothetical protein
MARLKTLLFNPITIAFYLAVIIIGVLPIIVWFFRLFEPAVSAWYNWWLK